MDRGDSPLSSGAKIKLITSVVAKKKVSKFDEIMKQFYCIFYEQKMGNTSYSNSRLVYEVLMASNGEHTMSLSHHTSGECISK